MHCGTHKIKVENPTIFNNREIYVHVPGIPWLMNSTHKTIMIYFNNLWLIFGYKLPKSIQGHRYLFQPCLIYDRHVSRLFHIETMASWNLLSELQIDNTFSTTGSFHIYRADARIVPSQWETALLCNDVSHWLGTNLESALIYTHTSVQDSQPDLCPGTLPCLCLCLCSDSQTFPWHLTMSMSVSLLRQPGICPGTLPCLCLCLCSDNQTFALAPYHVYVYVSAQTARPLPWHFTMSMSMSLLRQPDLCPGTLPCLCLCLYSDSQTFALASYHVYVYVSAQTARPFPGTLPCLCLCLYSDNQTFALAPCHVYVSNPDGHTFVPAPSHIYIYVSNPDGHTFVRAPYHIYIYVSNPDGHTFVPAPHHIYIYVSNPDGHTFVPEPYQIYVSLPDGQTFSLTDGAGPLQREATTLHTVFIAHAFMPQTPATAIKKSNTVRYRYNKVNFIQNYRKRHTIPRPLGRGMVCFL